MMIYAWASTDVGRKRSHNEDSYLLAQDMKLFAVADGMGGYNGGEVASDIAVRTLDDHLRQHRDVLARTPQAAFTSTADPVAVLFAESVQQANARIRTAGQDNPALRGMGTTTTGILFHGQRAYVAHVGDSRVYLVRGDRIRQLSEDHSLVQQQLRAGLITEEQARKSPFKNIITRSVGIEANVDVDVVALDVCAGDTFLLCSDGLSNLVTDAEINQIVNEHFLHRVPEVLIDLANERGGGDNITVVVAYAVDQPVPAALDAVI